MLTLFPRRGLILGAIVGLALALSIWSTAGWKPAGDASAANVLTIGLDMSTNTSVPGTYTTLPAFESCVDVRTSVNLGMFYIDVFTLNASGLIAFNADLKFDSGMQIVESDVRKFFGSGSGVYNLSQNISPPLTGTTVSPPVSGGTYAASAVDTASTHSGSGVLTRLKAQALIPPSGGRLINFRISTDPSKGITLTDNAPPPNNHPGDTNGDTLFDGPFINANGKIAVDRPDTDSDGFSNDCDNCPTVSNVLQTDNDKDGLGDACDPDDDNDGVPDTSDNCPLIANPGQQDVNGNGIGDACEDSDGDGVGDGIDNCPSIANADQANNDGDSMGDVCDPDDDNDGVPDTSDNCPLIANPSQKDWNNDGIGDACQNSDGDPWLDANDNCPGVTNEGQADQDLDGVGDVCDNCPTAPNANQGDFDSDGIGDACENSDGDYPSFYDAEEVHVTTHPGRACALTSTPNDEPQDAFPPDVNDNRAVNLQDVLTYIPIFGLAPPHPNYNQRFDMSMDNKVGLNDILMFIPVFGQTC